jgi:hypothetical protein
MLLAKGIRKDSIASLMSGAARHVKSAGVIFRFSLGYFGWETLKSIEPKRWVVSLKIDFNYNFSQFSSDSPPPDARVW